MGPFILAWIVGEGIIIYRSAWKQRIPPGPGQLLLSSGLFVMLGIMAEFESARKLALMLAWGFDIAAFMNLFPLPAADAETAKKNWPPGKASDEVIIPDGKPGTLNIPFIGPIIPNQQPGTVPGSRLST